MAILPAALQSSVLTSPEGVVWKIDAVPCLAGDALQLTFEDVAERWRQGVWLATDGLLRISGHEVAQAVIWHDTAPTAVAIEVVSTDGLLRLYNVWDSGRGRNMESQAATSGMLRDDTPTGWRYRCSDIGADPAFDALVFRLDRV